MKNRLTTITTKIGDSGKTRLADNSALSKDSDLIEAIGAIDELNAVLGMLVASLKNKAYFQTSDGYTVIKNIQQHLFDIGAELATKSSQKRLTADKVQFLETHIAAVNAELPPLQEFVIPGEDTVSATAHFARSVARRAERRLVTLLNTDNSFEDSEILKYINRLSDFLFVFSRQLARLTSKDEAQWHNP